MLKDRQREVACSVPHCEAEYCNRTRKKQCALRKYFILEVIKHRKNQQLIINNYGKEYAKEYTNKKFFWRKEYATKKN
jgi:hypothetical protein